nr:putative ribonuclease H-like domain-containing protein [Tanacetum cinerariifolium]
MRPFGCHVTILNTLDHLGKFDGKSDEGFFVGYSTNSNAFRVYNTRTRKVEKNLHINFLEDKPIITSNGPKWLFDIDALTESMNYVPVITGTNTNDCAGKGASFDACQSSIKTRPSQDYILIPLWNDDLLFDSSSKDSDGDNKDNDGPCKDSKVDNQERPNAENSTKDANTCGPSINTASSNINTASPTVNTDRQSDDFFGTDNDMRSLDGVEVDISNISTTYPVPTTPNTKIHKDHSFDNVIGDIQSGVWTLVDLPQGKRAIGTTWVFRNKKDKRGIVIRDKARLVAHGFTQEEGIDYDEFFAHVARIEAIRLFLAYASFTGFLVYQMDVKSAFLYERIEEEVYVCQPLGFKDPNYPDKVYKVEKALYGLHQAPRAWYETLAKYLLDNGFHRGKIDQTLFIKRQKEDIMLVQVYIDDIIFGSTKKELCTEFEKLIHDKFQMSSMGELTFFLGLQVKQKSDEIFISQDKYIDENLRKFKYTDVKPTSTLMDREKALLKDSDGDDVDVHLYRRSTKNMVKFDIGQEDDKLVISKPLSVIFIISIDHVNLSHYPTRPKPRTLIKLYTSHQSLMANLEFCDKHNMVAFLKKPQGSEEFHQTVDFLNSSHIMYALTKNPTIYVSLINQFWCTASAKTLDNGEIELNAIVDGQDKTITEASVRRHLKLADADGISTLPTTKIFEKLALMGKTRTKTRRIGHRIPQSNVPLSVIDEAITKEMHDGFGRATTTASRLESKQGGALYSSVSKSDETEPFEEGETAATPPPFGYRIAARISVQPHILMTFHSESEVERLLAIPTPPLSPVSLTSYTLPPLLMPLPIYTPLPTSSFPLPSSIPSTSGESSIAATTARQIRPTLTIADKLRADDKLIGRLRIERRYFYTLATTYAKEDAHSRDYYTQIIDYCQSREVHTRTLVTQIEALQRDVNTLQRQHIEHAQRDVAPKDGDKFPHEDSSSRGFLCHVLEDSEVDDDCEESDEIERYVSGLPKMIRGNVMSYKSKSMQKAIESANEQMDQKLIGIADRQADNKRKFDNNSRNQQNQQPFRRNNNVSLAYAAGSVLSVFGANSGMSSEQYPFEFEEDKIKPLRLYTVIASAVPGPYNYCNVAVMAPVFDL